MDLSPGSLLASVFVGAIGFGFFQYGRKQHRLPQIVAGIALMVYPYFVPSVGWMLAVGTAVLVALWCVIQSGL